MRTPLSSMYTTIELLKMTSPGGRSTTLLEKLEQQAREIAEHLDKLAAESAAPEKPPVV